MKLWVVKTAQHATMMRQQRMKERVIMIHASVVQTKLLATTMTVPPKTTEHAISARVPMRHPEA
jgi:hypothetical protein